MSCIPDDREGWAMALHRLLKGQRSLSYADLRQKGEAIGGSKLMQSFLPGIMQFLKLQGMDWPVSPTDDSAEVFLCHRSGVPKVATPYVIGLSFRVCSLERWADPECCPAIISRLHPPIFWGEEDFVASIYSKAPARAASREPIVVLFGNGQYIQLSPTLEEIGPHHLYRKAIEEHFRNRGLDFLTEQNDYGWNNPWRGTTVINPALKAAIDNSFGDSGVTPPRRRGVISVQSINRQLLTQGQAATRGKPTREPARVFTPHWRRLAGSRRPAHDRVQQRRG